MTRTLLSALCLLGAPALASEPRPAPEPLRWATSLDAALKTAAAEKKLVLVYVLDSI